MAPTIENHGGHSRTKGWDQVPGTSPAWLAAPAMNVRDTTKVYIWRLDTGYGPTLYRKCHSHNTPGKRHNNTWVEPFTGNNINSICCEMLPLFSTPSKSNIHVSRFTLPHKMRGFQVLQCIFPLVLRRLQARQHQNCSCLAEWMSAHM